MFTCLPPQTGFLFRIRPTACFKVHQSLLLPVPPAGSPCLYVSIRPVLCELFSFSVCPHYPLLLAMAPFLCPGVLLFCMVFLVFVLVFRSVCCHRFQFHLAVLFFSGFALGPGFSLFLVFAPPGFDLSFVLCFRTSAVLLDLMLSDHQNRIRLSFQLLLIPRAASSRCPNLPQYSVDSLVIV